jgi:hypothetical protein
MIVPQEAFGKSRRADLKACLALYFSGLDRLRFDGFAADSDGGKEFRNRLFVPLFGGFSQAQEEGFQLHYVIEKPRFDLVNLLPGKCGGTLDGPGNQI